MKYNELERLLAEGGVRKDKKTKSRTSFMV